MFHKNDTWSFRLKKQRKWRMFRTVCGSKRWVENIHKEESRDLYFSKGDRIKIYRLGALEGAERA